MDISIQPETAPVKTRDGVSLIQQSRQLELLIMSVVDYAIYMLDLNGNIASWNSGGARIKGYDAEEVIGRHFSIFYTQEDVAAGLPDTALTCAATTGQFEAEGWRVRKDGSRFWASVVIDAIREDGKLLGFAKVTRDITERKRSEQALEEAQNALLQAQKLEAVGQLTYGMAHDFNNLLTVVGHSLERLRTMRQDDDKFDRAMTTARRALDRGTRLTKQLLAFSRGQVLRPKAVDVNALIRDAEVLLSRVCDERVELSLDLCPGSATIQADPTQLEASLLNLVINACDAISEANGRIKVSTEIHGEHLTVSVSDNGSGMTPEVAKRATEPFFTTKEVGKGSGLGLSQVYGFVKQSGGSFELRSAAEGGTTISMHFPVSGMVEAAAQPTVLLVDDDENILDVVQESLRDAGYAVLTAANGSQALQILTEDAGKLDVVFSDVSMPGGMSGIELAQHAYQVRPNLRVILTSGYSPNWLPELPPNCEFLPKPYEMSDLDRRLRRKRRQSDQAAPSE